jgi:mitogen-activated protein kinase 1/3
VILLEKEYTRAVDIWSLGCVFAEMLWMNEDNCEFYERAPLFPGGSCFPLSPDLRTSNVRGGYPSSDGD